MNKLGPRNSVNVNIAIHIPNSPSSLKTNGLTFKDDQGAADAEYVYDPPRGGALDPAKFKDIVEISPKARKLATKQK